MAIFKTEKEIDLVLYTCQRMVNENEGVYKDESKRKTNKCSEGFNWNSMYCSYSLLFNEVFKCEVSFFRY